MKTIFKKIIFSLIGIGSAAFLNAQEPISALDTLPGNVEQIQSDISVIKKLKITGYIQAQWQMADTIGVIAPFSAGNFTNSDNRFMIRRGRIKFAYTNELSNYVLQFDVTERGVTIKDAYVSFTDPWLKAITLTGGAFDRPFGYEISYSSSLRETPERARITQSLFVQERDLGTKLTLQAPKTSPLNFLRLDAGLFNGNGLNPETDNYKDFIGHLSANKTFMSENLAVGAGVSIYNGGWANLSKYTYKMEGTSFIKDSSYAIGAQLKRQYIGFDAQVTLNTVLGITTLRGEYIFGTQPGTKAVSISPVGIWNDSPVTTYTTTIDTATNAAVTTAKISTAPSEAYIREFTGGYVYFVQSIGQTKHELVVKYDWYDPNTKVAGNDIGITDSKTSATDVSYNTLGLGWIYHWNSNVKITAYYEIVDNERSDLLRNASKIKTFSTKQAANVFTLRVQYKF